ncbi:NnrU family protein [Methylobacterium sp. 092160098-2]|uniref:NnrU family protein n=1 Tax=Methylobacterium sp. 092160098-2 TaxID=3025129 RepID=UPI002381A639|nr:NnrU family protein [Methylobacterium sp. 092160098-2]MDE4914606.1 NnrU family protein [Methylobacterium sp. 092160098-2]
MTEFALAMVAFLAAHSVPATPRLRAHVVGRLGRHAYVASYSTLSLVLLAWVVAAARRANTGSLWQPARWQWFVPQVVVRRQRS